MEPGKMIHDTIQRIEHEIDQKLNNNDQKQELLELVAHLKVEIESLKDRYHDDARSIAKFTEAGFIEATRETRDDELFSHALEGMKLSVRRFEVSHPRLIGVINAIGQTLTNLGI
jgi:hypothetical protein